jgi:KH/beta-lactamase-domain protein
MPNIKDVVRNELPDGKVDEIAFEGANIILYSTDKDFCFGNDDLIKDIVNKIKKRVELRPDPSLTISQDEAQDTIKEIVPDKANLDKITFDEERSIVVLEAENTQMLTGRDTDVVDTIKQETYWIPEIKRTPIIRSPIIENIRGVLYQNSKERRDFLNETGKRVYNGWQRNQKKDEWVRVSFLGGSRQVGRSCLLLQTPESNVVLDCGIDVAGDDESAYPYLQAPEFDIRDIDAVIVTHCHVDHTGLVPYLYKFGYDGPVYCTAPTRDIMALLQLDTIKIHQNEGRKELYSQEHVKKMVEHTIPLDYRQVTDLTPDVRLTLYNAGHTIGSAMAHLNIGNGLHNLLYTGDIKYKDTRLLSKAHTRFRRVETMIMESTYGGKDNKTNDEDQDEKLSAIVKDTIKRNGKVLMPVLGSGRGQEIIMMIVNLMREGEIPEVPIYVDGMVWDITAIHTAYPEFLNRNVRHDIFNEGNNPFTHDSITKVGSHREREKIIEEAEPCIVLATSGMLVGGPSVEYLKGFAEDQRSSLIFSCYQGDGSLGRRIQSGQRRLTFREGSKEENLNLKMNVSKIQVSGHADRDELMHFVKRLKPQPNRILINHGDKDRSIDLRTSLHKRFHMRTEVPRNLDSLRLK